MKTVFFFYVFVVVVPLLCEENSYVGFRLSHNKSRGYFLFDGRAQTVNIITTLVCFTLCLLSAYVAFANWRNKGIRLYTGRYGNFSHHNRRTGESNVERILVKNGEDIIPVRAARGTLIRLNGSTIEMLIWFILHEQLRVDLRILRFFPINRRGPVYTVEQILEGETEEFITLQRFIFRHGDFGRRGKNNNFLESFQGNSRQSLCHNKSRGMAKDEATVMTAVSCHEVPQNEQCDNGEMNQDPCFALNPEKGTESQEDTGSDTCPTVRPENGKESREEVEPDEFDDDFESGDEPANMIRKALTLIFSKVKRDVEEAAAMKNSEGCDEIESAKKDSLETPVEYDSTGKEENESVSEDGLKAEKSKGNVSEVEEFLKPVKESVEVMREMIRAMCGPHVEKKEFDGSCEFLDDHMEKVTGKNSKPAFVFHEDSMEKDFEEENGLYSSDMGENIKRTVKAYYGMAGGFTNHPTESSEQNSQDEQSAHAYDITDGEWQTLDSIQFREERNNLTGTVQSNSEFKDYGFWRYVQELPVPQCSLGQLQAEAIIANMEKQAASRRTWDYSKIAIGCGAAAVTLFALYRCFRR